MHSPESSVRVTASGMADTALSKLCVRFAQSLVFVFGHQDPSICKDPYKDYLLTLSPRDGCIDTAKNSAYYGKIE